MDKLDKLNRFLHHLHKGFILQVDGRTYGMTEDYQLYCLPYIMNGSELTDEVDTSHPLGMQHLPLSYWIELADKISDDDFAIMAANQVLNELNKKVR